MKRDKVRGLTGLCWMPRQFPEKKSETERGERECNTQTERCWEHEIQAEIHCGREKNKQKRGRGGEIMADAREPDICTAYPLVPDLCFN